MTFKTNPIYLTTSVLHQIENQYTLQYNDYIFPTTPDIKPPS